MRNIKGLIQQAAFDFEKQKKDYAFCEQIILFREQISERILQMQSDKSEASKIFANKLYFKQEQINKAYKEFINVVETYGKYNQDKQSACKNIIKILDSMCNKLYDKNLYDKSKETLEVLLLKFMVDNYKIRFTEVSPKKIAHYNNFFKFVDFGPEIFTVDIYLNGHLHGKESFEFGKIEPVNYNIELEPLLKKNKISKTRILNKLYKENFDLYK